MSRVRRASCTEVLVGLLLAAAPRGGATEIPGRDALLGVDLRHPGSFVEARREVRLGSRSGEGGSPRAALVLREPPGDILRRGPFHLEVLAEREDPDTVSLQVRTWNSWRLLGYLPGPLGAPGILGLRFDGRVLRASWNDHSGEIRVHLSPRRWLLRGEEGRGAEGRWSSLQGAGPAFTDRLEEPAPPVPPPPGGSAPSLSLPARARSWLGRRTRGRSR